MMSAQLIKDVSDVAAYRAAEEDRKPLSIWSERDSTHIPFLGEIPLDTQVRVSGDVGIPLTMKESTVAKSFAAVAQTLAGQVSVLNYTKKEKAK